MLEVGIDGGGGAADRLYAERVQGLLEAASQSMGQVEVRMDGESFILNAKTREGIELSRGASAVVVEQISGSDIYIVAPFNQV